MDYDFSNGEKTFIEEIRTLIADLAKTRTLESGDPVQAESAIRSALDRLAPTGYLRAGFDPDAPGQVALMAAMEAVAGVSPSLLLAMESSTRVFGRAVNTWGDDGVRSQWLVPLTQGRLLGAVALSELAMNVENDPLATEGHAEGSDLVISGHKQYVVNAPVADWIAVVGRIADAPAIFLVEKGTPGLSIDPPMETLGYDGAMIGALRLEGCRIPSDQALLPGIDARAMLDQLRMWENQVLIAASLGMMGASFEAARDYAKGHKSGGRPIIAYQEVGFKLSEMLTLLQTSQLYAYRTAWTTEKKPKEAASLTRCAKVFCSESAERVAGQALQILAGSGFRSGHAAERAYRGAKYNQIAGTSTEIARVNIGDEALGYV
ncbi:MAG: acyl-CoA dehydrogenase [Desulfobacterales bacterium]|nr:acyl-CoA dehydrogenase [Desulfobacterales bacterium]